MLDCLFRYLNKHVFKLSFKSVFLKSQFLIVILLPLQNKYEHSKQNARNKGKRRAGKTVELRKMCWETAQEKEIDVITCIRPLTVLREKRQKAGYARTSH